LTPATPKSIVLVPEGLGGRFASCVSRGLELMVADSARAASSSGDSAAAPRYLRVVATAHPVVTAGHDHPHWRRLPVPSHAPSACCVGDCGSHSRVGRCPGG